MNDLLVVALIYQIEHGRSVDYSGTPPLEHDEPGFRIRVEKGEVRFEFKDHHTTERAAREAIEEYIGQWEFTAGLRSGPGAFRLSFVSSEIEDRHPLVDSKPGVVNLRGSARSGAPRARATLTVTRRPPHYPPPPAGVKLTPDVKSMYDRYIDHLQDKEPLESMAYFCLTVIEDPFKGGRKEAAKHYNISTSVLNRIGELSSRRGCRKAEGMKKPPLTGQERRFLKQAIKRTIYRAAEKTNNPDSNLPKLSLSDLPRV